MEVIENFEWEPAQPNGVTDENHILFLPSVNKFRDFHSEVAVCVSCTIPYEIATLRGFCENSYLGTLNIHSCIKV